MSPDRYRLSDRDRERERERDRERTYRDIRSDRDGDRDFSHRRDGARDRERERLPAGRPEPASRPDSPRRESSGNRIRDSQPGHEKLAQVLGALMMVQNKRAPLEQHRAALEQQLKIKEEMYFKTRPYHSENPALQDIQDHHHDRLRREIHSVSQEIQKLDSESARHCESFGLNILKALPEMHARDVATKASIEERFVRMESQWRQREKNNMKALSEIMDRKLEQQLRASRDEMEKKLEAQRSEAEEIKRVSLELREMLKAYQEDVKTLQAQVDTLKQEKNALGDIFRAQASQGTKDKTRYAAQGGEDEDSIFIPVQAGELSCERNASSEALAGQILQERDDRANSEAKLRADLDKLCESHAELVKKVETGIVFKPTPNHSRNSAGDKSSNVPEAIRDEISRLHQSISKVQEASGEVKYNLETLRKNWTSLHTEREQTLARLTEGLSRQQILQAGAQVQIDKLSSDLKEYKEQCASFAARQRDVTSQQAQVLSGHSQLLAGCGSGVSKMMEEVINNFGRLVDILKDRIEVLEARPVQSVPGGATAEPVLSEQIQSRVQEACQKNEATIGRELKVVNQKIDTMYQSLVKDMEARFTTLNHMCLTLDNQYQNINTRELYHRILAEVNVTAPTTSSLFSQMSSLYSRVTILEQQLRPAQVQEGQEPPNKRVRTMSTSEE